MRNPPAPLTIARALRFTLRDLRGAPARTLALIFALAVSAASVYLAVSCLSSFRLFLISDSRQWFAADLQVILNHVPEPEDLQALPPQTADLTVAIETQVVARAPSTGLSAPVTLKAVDPSAYPFYGQLALRPPAPLPTALAGNQVAVNPEILTALDLHPGDELEINHRRFRTTALIHREPDRFAAFPYTFHRVLLTRDALDASGVLRSGNNLNCRLLFRLHNPAALDAARAALERHFPDRDIADYRHPDPNTVQTLDLTAAYLAACLTAALLAAFLAASLLLHVHLDQRLDHFAILKVLGAGSRALATLAATHTLLITGTACAAGVLAGELAVRLTLPLLETWFRLPLPPHPVGSPLAAATASCLLAGVLLFVHHLTTATRVRPLRLLRRHVESSWRPAFLLPGAHTLSTFAALTAAATLVTLSATLHLGLAPSLTRAMPAPQATVAIISATFPQWERIRDWLSSQPGVEVDTTFPLVRLRLLQINGRPTLADRMWFALCHDDPTFPRGTALVSAAHARRLQVQAGDTLAFQLPGRVLQARISRLQANDTLIQSLLGIELACADLRPEAQLLAYAALKTPPGALPAFRQALARDFPTVVTVSREEFTDLSKDVLDQALLLLRAGFAAVAASCLLIMALMAAANARRRLPETALLRVLGASRRTLLRRHLRSYGLLGMAAGTAGGLAGAATAALLIGNFVQQTPSTAVFLPALAAIPLTALAAVLAAWTATRRVLQQRPMDTLREP